ncbi:hypothetical protein BDY19DRAFT_1046790 [Irpex rosettiformis]|uniref:Uncharacterized protein n=1 Tax=Irpex rosettiformis TaxID=378272 RepID=A0ACB8UA91_9APHY|nr:hypothetical protein BDY19DRAFT_1046790 [Irpex rosettiformis]
MAAPAGGPHQCLRVADIQALIFKYLKCNDCIRLARTCTFFYNEASNVIWSEVESWIPFVLCMPSDLVESTQSEESYSITLGFSRKPTSSDWQLFCKHAHRVRKFTDTKGFAKWLNEYSPSGRLIGSYPGTVSKLTTGRRPEVDGRLFNTFPQLLPAMRTRWPHLSDVSITASGSSEPCQAELYIEEIGWWVKNLVRLESIHVRVGCYTSLMEALSELPRLHTINLVGEADDIPDQALTFPSSSLNSRFPSLKEFSMVAYPPNSPLSLLQSLGSCGLHTLTKITLFFGCLTNPNRPAFIQAPMIIEAVSRLLSIDFLDLSFGENMRLSDPVPAVPALSTRLFAMLFRLRRLRHLKLVGFFKILITNKDLQDAATAWSELEHLDLVLATCNSAPFMITNSSHLSLVGVQALYNGCPNLKAVDLPVNDELPITNDCLDLPAARPRDPVMAMEKLSLRFYPIDEEFEFGSEEYMPIVVHLLFPQLKELKTCHYDIDEVYPPGADDEDWVKLVQTRWEKYRDMEQEEVRALLDQKWSELSAELDVE